jgi:excisionase family DNA binding protein
MKNFTTKTERGASLIAPGADRLIDKQEAAEIFGFSVKWVERRIAEGALIAQTFGRSVRLRLSDVLKFARIESEIIPPQ